MAEVSVVIRAKDEAASIGRTLELVAAQTLAAQIIVVDSGSTDGTGDIAREHGAEVVWIPASEFTFGGALNLGTQHAKAPIVVALSAHAYPRDERWLKRLVSVFEAPNVACAVGAETGPDGEQIVGRIAQDEGMARRNPVVGYSNASGAYRRDLWEQYEFRADMPGTEDKEWAWHWLQRGYVCVLGPDLTVDHDHTKDPLKDTWVRARREWIGYSMYLDLPKYPLREAVRDWRTGARKYRHPLNILREGVRVAGEYSIRRRRAA
jgi:rhamnosyltransferase